MLDETGLLPHLNPGVLTDDDLRALRPVAASMGLMLETTSERLSERGGPHFGSPDKLPARRLETIEAAGRQRVPFTTGILIGIGETRAERIDALLAIAASHARHGHVQEVIVQNFRAKPGTRMADAPEPPLEELLWTAAAARLVLRPERASPVPAEPLLRRVPAPARRRDRRLGRHLAGHRRPRQPGGAVARGRARCARPPRSAGFGSRRGCRSIRSTSADVERWCDARRRAGGAKSVRRRRPRA